MQDYMKFTKGADTKLIEKGSNLVAALLNDGWKSDDCEKPCELSELRAEAEALGLKPHHKSGAEKLKEMIKDAQK